MNYQHEHTEYCATVTVQPFRKSVSADKCGTCKAWFAGYRAALQPIKLEGEQE